MTLNEFMAKLAESKGMFRLERAIEALERKGAIRCRDADGRSFCPITRVAHQMTGKFFPTQDVPKAAEEIKLGAYDSGNIIKAADDNCHSEFEVRVEMLKVLGLKEPA